jgi:hypothetical protein
LVEDVLKAMSNGVSVENAGLNAEASRLREGLHTLRTEVADVGTEQAGLEAGLQNRTA